MKNVIIFGANGMLGRYVSQYLSEQNYYVVKMTRNDIDLANTTIEEIKSKIELYNNAVIINCAGAIIQKLSDYGEIDMIKVNSVFPWQLAEACDILDYKLIHITTDCIYSGLDGMYDEKSLPSPMDVYGGSKSLGEPKTATIVRTSIIGEELTSKKSFIEWVKSEKGNTVNGYERNIWNGITCLQFAKICDQIITKNLYWEGVRHFPSPDKYKKSDLVKLVSDVYELDVTVEPVELPVQMCNRTISTIYNNIKRFNIPTIKEQLVETKNYKLRNSL